jgi:hypothetical protein
MDAVTPARKVAGSGCCIKWGIAQRALAGQTVSGDRYLMHAGPDRILMAVVDGLGHGEEAAEAAEAAMATIETYHQEPVISLLRRCHAALRCTRGAVISIASIDAIYESMVWLGVGNVEGIILRAERTTIPEQEHIPLLPGVVGYQLPRLRAVVTPMNRGDLIIFYTDGIRGDALSHPIARNSPQQIARRLCSEFNKGTDDALVLAARYVGSRSRKKAV